MTFSIRQHPMIFFATFPLPALLMVLGAVFHASAFLFIICGTWIGVALMILYLPVETDNGQ